MKKIVVIILVVISIIASGLIGYRIGASNQESISQETFYAKIIEMNGQSLLVSGLQINDLNFRGYFTFKISEETDLMWRFEKINSNDFNVGDIISVTFTGEIEESDPAGLVKILKVQLLDDEL